MPVQYNDQDDYDHFGTSGIIINGFDLDNLSVREALKRIMNILIARGEQYIGSLSLVSLRSIRETEILVNHLINGGFVVPGSVPETYKAKF